MGGGGRERVRVLDGLVCEKRGEGGRVGSRGSGGG